jgi:hypothetical protein
MVNSAWMSLGRTSASRRSHASRNPVVKMRFITRRNVRMIRFRSIQMPRLRM